MVRQRSAKPLFVGSIPTVASIAVPPHFSFRATVESHGWYRLAPFRWSPDENVLRRAELLGRSAVDLAISFDGTALRINRRATPELTKRIRRMFQLQIDTTEFAELARSSEAHRSMIESGYGRLLCGSTLFEDVVKIIATTNTTWGNTVRMIELLVEKCGSRTRSGAAAFPSPEQVARFSSEELQRDCRLGYRAKTIQMVANDTRLLATIVNRELTAAEQYKQFQKLPGIGPYGAAHLLAMEGRHDFIAVDTEFRSYMKRAHFRGRDVPDEKMVRHFARWGRWQYLAYWLEMWGAERNEP